MLKTTSKAAKALVGVGLLLLVIVGAILSNARSDDTRLFVAVHREKAVQFVEILEALLRESGLETSVSHATDDRGNTHTVLRGQRGNFDFWMASVVLSGEDTSAPCERRSEAYPDPEQFEIRLRPRVPFVPTKRLSQVLNQLRELFKQRGVPYQEVPWPCGAVALSSAGQ